MPSRGNPNVPTSVKNRARSRKAGLKASAKARPRPVVARTDPSQPVTKSGSGVHRERTASSKAVRRSERKSYYAVKRKEAAGEEVRKAGEGGVVEMTDVTVVPLSRRQEKLAARAAAVAEANAKAVMEKEAEAAEEAEKAEKAEKEAAEAEAEMDID